MEQTKRPRYGNREPTSHLLHHPWLLPAAVALVLSLPCFRFGYLWDDYGFLENALVHRLVDLLPDPRDYFYRPLSRGLYFMFLSAAGGAGPLLSHFLNSAMLIAAIWLLTTFTSRLAGSRAGLATGLIFAALGVAPFLTGWASGVQDLLAMVFIMAALRFRLARRTGAALAATVGGLLAKETTLVVVPILVLFDWILGRKPTRVAPQLAIYGVATGAWAAIHPGIRVLLARGLRSGATGYVGLEHLDTSPIRFAKYVITLLNVPVTGLATHWPANRTVVLLLAGAVAIAGLRTVWRDMKGGALEAPPRMGRVLALAVSLCVLPLLLTATMVRGWTPYYACAGGLGSSLLIGTLLSRLRLRWTSFAVGAFLVLGVWSRGLELPPGICTEMSFARASETLGRIEAGFHRLRRDFPPGSQILLSVQSGGSEGIYTHLLEFQALRVWYHDPSLLTRKPQERVPGDRPEFLMAVTPSRDVIAIDLGTLRVASSGAEPDYAFVEGAVREYAMGLSGSGATDAAVRILLNMPEVSAHTQSLHRRMAVMLLFAAGDSADANRILDQISPTPHDEALANLRAVLAEQPSGRDYDAAALRAFGISDHDAVAFRDLMRWFASMKYAEAAIRFADRIEALSPGDVEARSVFARMRNVLEEREKHLPLIE